MSGKKHRRKQLSLNKRQLSEATSAIPGIEIPQGDSKDEKKARKQIIKDFYARWISANPDKKVWNPALCAFIYVKGKSINETSGQASISYESTQAVFRLSDILSSAVLVKRMPWSDRRWSTGEGNGKPL